MYFLNILYIFISLNGILEIKKVVWANARVWKLRGLRKRINKRSCCTSLRKDTKDKSGDSKVEDRIFM
jgi:hypothetical protein